MPEAAHGSPFGPRLHALALYLKTFQAVSFVRLEGMLSDLFGVKISQGGLANMLKRSHAPFAVSNYGRVLELHVDTHEMPGSAAPLLTVVDDSVLELDLIVPSIWLQWVSVGVDFEFTVEETGQSYQAKISRLGAKVDAVSQTIKISGIFINRPKFVLPGMSGVARFDPPTQ